MAAMIGKAKWFRSLESYFISCYSHSHILLFPEFLELAFLSLILNLRSLYLLIFSFFLVFNSLQGVLLTDNLQNNLRTAPQPISGITHRHSKYYPTEKAAFIV